MRQLADGGRKLAEGMEVMGAALTDSWSGGGGLRTSLNFYKAVVQTVLLFGGDNWIMSPMIGKTLGGFHHRVACWMAGIWTRRDTMDRWVYPPLGTEMTAVILEEVDT